MSGGGGADANAKRLGVAKPRFGRQSSGAFSWGAKDARFNLGWTTGGGGSNFGRGIGSSGGEMRETGGEPPVLTHLNEI